MDLSSIPNQTNLEDSQNNNENKNTNISQDYKNLNDKCEEVLVKINKRKKNVKSK